MLSPMLVQYLVGLCCVRHHSDAVEIILGDMVPDVGAGKKRDVDVTVTLDEASGSRLAFKAYEVKREGAPLDVATVEQLCLKLGDMPDVTHRALVSSSGYTEAALAKAAYHGVELYELSPWSGRLEEAFPSVGLRGAPEDALPLDKMLLVWTEYTLHLVARDGPSSFNVQGGDRIYSPSGVEHSRFRNFGDYSEDLLLRSTEFLYRLWPASDVARIFPPTRETSTDQVVTPAWPHAHTLDVTTDEVFLHLPEGLTQISAVTISGRLRWELTRRQGQYYLMSRVGDGEVFAGAVIAEGEREGQMYALVASPASASVGVHIIALEERHLNAIRDLSIRRSAVLDST